MSRRLARYQAGDSPLSLDAERIAVFTDLHLQPQQYAEIVAFARSLMELVGRCDALVVLGDLFESYIGREDFTHPAFDPMREAFACLRAEGCEIVLLRGNRDVLLNSSDGRHLGFTVADAVLCDSVPGGLLLTHGDAFCLGDLAYQRLRRLLRLPGVRPCLRALPGWLRARMARRLRSYSVQEVARKPLDSLHLTLSAVERVMAEEGVRQAWIGHLHAAGDHLFADGRHLRVLDAWSPGTPAVWIPENLDETG